MKNPPARSCARTKQTGTVGAGPLHAATPHTPATHLVPRYSQFVTNSQSLCLHLISHCSSAPHLFVLNRRAQTERGRESREAKKKKKWENRILIKIVIVFRSKGPNKNSNIYSVIEEYFAMEFQFPPVTVCVCLSLSLRSFDESNLIKWINTKINYENSESIISVRGKDKHCEYRHMFHRWSVALLKKSFDWANVMFYLFIKRVNAIR